MKGSIGKIPGHFILHIENYDLNSYKRPDFFEKSIADVKSSLKKWITWRKCIMFCGIK